MTGDAVTEPPSPAGSKPFGRAWWFVFIALTLLPAVWAGDEQFIFDEPALLSKALRANAQHRWEVVGLTGTVGHRYGPLSIWIYQGGLHLTRDPVMMVRLHAVLVMGLTLVGCAWIAWLLGVGGAWVMMIGLSPYLVIYARALWDNSFNIPLSAIAAAATLHAIIRRSLWPLPVIVAVCESMMLIHPMSLAMVAGLFLALLIYARPILRGQKPRHIAAAILGIFIVLAAGWWISSGYREAFFKPSTIPVYVSAGQNGWWFALFSPRLISGVWLEYFFSSDYLGAMPLAGVLSIARLVSGAVFLLAWAGVPLTVANLRHRQDVLTVGGVLALCTTASQLALNVYTHTFGQPHYYNATWIAAAILVAITLTHLARRPKGAVVSAVLVAVISMSLGLTVVLIGRRLHATGGTREITFGSSISNQMEIAHAIQQHDPQSAVQLSAMLHPESIGVLIKWMEPYDPAPANPPLGNLEIRYVHPEDPFDAHLELVELPR